MKYHYERPEFWMGLSYEVYHCNHPMYNTGTIFTDEERLKGLVIVQKRFNKNLKIFWWGPIDPWLSDDLVMCADWNDWFNEHAEEKNKDGLYPTYSIRKVMWAMRLKPLKKEEYEQWLDD